MDTRAELHIAMGDASHSRPGKRTPLMRACASGHLEASFLYSTYSTYTM